MIITLLAAAILAPDVPDFAETNITGATIFRNGYGFVVSETWLDQSGTTYIRALPQAVEGTLWFAPGKYAKIKDITVTMMEIEPVVQNAETIPEILALNVGRDITVSLIRYADRDEEVVTGKVLSVTRSQMLLQTAGALRSINFASIQSLAGLFDDFTTSAETKVSAPVLKVTSEPNTGGTIYTISLIEGVTWVPAYNIELQDEGKLSLALKATVLNSIGNFDKIDVGLMSGFPKIDNISSRDPLTAGLQMMFEATESSNRLAMVKGQQTYGGAGFGGGFGGGGFSSGGPGRAANVPPTSFAELGISTLSYDPSDNSLIANKGYDKRFRELDQSLKSVEQENFFIYGIDDYEHKIGDRKYLVIDDGDLEYELSHRINTSSGNTDVTTQRFIVFENGLDVPLTRASAMITRGGELIGKTEVPYTYMGDEVELSIGTAPYMLSKVATRIVKINKGKLRLRDKRIFDEIENVDTVTITNLGSRPAKTLIHHRLNGEVFRVSPKAVESKTSTSDSVNIDYLFEWEVEIAPGETKTFEIEYSSYRYVGMGK